MQYDEITEKQWSRMPAPATTAQKNREEWRPVFDALSSGRAVSIPVSGRSEAARLKISVMNRARRHGIALEYRSDDERVAFRLRDQSGKKSGGARRKSG